MCRRLGGDANQGNCWFHEEGFSAGEAIHGVGVSEGGLGLMREDTGTGRDFTGLFLFCEEVSESLRTHMNPGLEIQKSSKLARL